jgi:hypothetical protein
MDEDPSSFFVLKRKNQRDFEAMKGALAASLIGKIPFVGLPTFLITIHHCFIQPICRKVYK